MSPPVVRTNRPPLIFRRKATGFNSLLVGAVRRVRIQGSSSRSGKGRTAGCAAVVHGPPVGSGGAVPCEFNNRQHVAVTAHFPDESASVVGPLTWHGGSY